MGGTYIISDYSDKMKKLVTKLSIPASNVISNAYCTQEKDYHVWLTKEFESKNIDKLIIPLSLPTDAPVVNTNGFLIGLHIRLNYELDLNKRLIPIIYLSNFTLETIINNNSFDKDCNPQNIIFTKGVYFSSFDIEDVKTETDKALACPESEYQSSILSKLNIRRKATIGNHDISNAWGCYKLAQVVGIHKSILEENSISNHLQQLYAKYLICVNDSFNNERRIDLEPLKCADKNILFIDDKSDEGWAKLMEKIFSKANLTYVRSSKYTTTDNYTSFLKFNDFYQECESHLGKKWDLILIDLRLNPNIEDVDNENITPENLSGYKLIGKFIEYNIGYQIIVFTASNKIWNVNAALKRGAYSYYIKESPESNYSVNETKQHYDNFKKDVKECFERDYLRDIYSEKKKLLKDKINTLSDSKFKGELKNQLDISYTLLSDAKTKEQFAYAYVSLYKIIEIVNKKFVDKESVNNEVDDKEIIEEWKIDKKDNLPNIEFDKENGAYIINGTIKGNKPPEWQKIAGIYLYKQNNNLKDINRSDTEFIREIYHLITKRNGFVHNDKDILDKKDKNGRYLNHDIYKPEGFKNLFKYIKQIINFI